MQDKTYKFVPTFEMKPNTRAKFSLDINDYDKVSNTKHYNIQFTDNKILINNNITGVIGKIRYDAIFESNQHKPLIYYDLINNNGGGRFVIYENNLAEFTIYGSGKPIISSYLGRIKKI